jgi:DNA mismatch endonuclease, patch repair protein
MLGGCGPGRRRWKGWVALGRGNRTAVFRSGAFARQCRRIAERTAANVSVVATIGLGRNSTADSAPRCDTTLDDNDDVSRMGVLVDTLSPAARSERMGRVRSKDTQPEKLVRSRIHRMGLRYRLHRRDLPGCPDLVFPRHRIALFVHGCFWHRHGECPLTRWPKTRIEFWRPKLEGNRARDVRIQQKLRELGWRVVVIWECETQNPTRLESTLTSRLAA